MIDPRSKVEASGTATSLDTGAHEKDLQIQHTEAATADAYHSVLQNGLTANIGKRDFCPESMPMLLEEIDTRTMKVYPVATSTDPLQNRLQNDNQVKYAIDSSIIESGIAFHNLNASEKQYSSMPENLSQEFTAQRAIGVTKTVVTEEPQLKVLTSLQPFGFTKMAVADNPKTKTVVRPNITIKNELFFTDVDAFLSDIRNNT